MAAPHSDGGEWLCPTGNFQALIKALCACDPRLRQRDPLNISQETPWPAFTGIAVGLHLEADGSYRPSYEWSERRQPDVDFSSELRRGAVINPKGHNVLLIEGLSPRMIEALGSYFNIHPSLFVDHERVEVFSNAHLPGSDLTALPSFIRSQGIRNGVTLRYYEVVNLEPMPESFTMCCAKSGRHIGGYRVHGDMSPSVVGRRKCSLWRTLHHKGGSTSVVICDPPLGTIRVRPRGSSDRVNHAVSATAYQGGYRDFISSEAQQQVLEGPRRSGLLEDLKFYLTRHGPRLPRSDEADCAALLVNKIVASHYLTLFSFGDSILSSGQWQLSRRQDMRSFKLDRAEQQWSDAQAWDRRIHEYASDLDNTMLKLGISIQEPEYRRGQNPQWLDSDIDFQFLRMRFETLKVRVGQINAAITGLVGIAGNRQAQTEQNRSTRQSQRAAALTFIGLLFVPLAYASTLLSMNERYIPGASDFWLYFALSGPLVLVTLFIYIVLDITLFKEYFFNRRFCEGLFRARDYG